MTDSDVPDPRTSGIALRPATISDLERIMDIETSVFAEDAWSSELMRHELTDSNTHYIVAVLDGVLVAGRDMIVGYAGVLAPPSSGDADIQTIATIPTVRGRGVGRVLMSELLTVARSRQAQRVFLEVRADNPVAMGLYRSLGFREIGVREGYYQPDNVDAVAMRLDLETSNQAGWPC